MKAIIAALVATATATTTPVGEQKTEDKCYWKADAKSNELCKETTDCCAIVTGSDHTKQVEGDGVTLKYAKPGEAAEKADKEFKDLVEDAGKEKGRCLPKAETSFTREDKEVLNYLCYTPENLVIATKKAKWYGRNCELETNDAAKDECVEAQSAAKTIAATFMTFAALAAMM